MLGLLCLVHATASAAGVDGQWRLQLTGHQDFFLGEGGFGGGIRMPWEVIIQFTIANGEFLVGSGSARWVDKVSGLSGPQNWFDCHLVAGTYLDSNLTMHETPRVRFAGFPLAGELEGDRVRLQPGYRAPGNYLALTYECETDNQVADNWLARAELGKQILGKRQDVETRHSGMQRIARVREVVSLPPENSVDLPLQDGWTFSQGSEDSSSQVTYRLDRVD
ncbi:hypothetical protein [Thiosocius teredinicola]|uniref:hypothetical protein n=1 Tax=Thiosocius teredinicola TaxID=1973002 RepID=UPI000990A996